MAPKAAASRQSLFSAFRDHAAPSPHERSVIDGTVTLTRGQVLAWATLLGEDLLRSGCGPGHLVALLLPRSWAVPCAMLAARSAGLAFLPLDVDAPSERVQAILAAAEPRAVVTFDDGTTPDRGPGGAHLLVAPPVPGLETLRVHLRPRGRTLPEGTGHVVFTSGSTGAPKGVLLRDGPLASTCAQQREWCGMRGAPVLWALNPAFDASLSDVFCALLGPSPLAVFRPSVLRVRELRSFVGEHGIRHADLPPSLLRVLSADGFDLASVVFGGEPCDVGAVRRWSGRGTGMLQAYGPTEAAVCAMMAVTHDGWTANELGRPLDHQVVTIRDHGGDLHRLMPRDPDARPSSGAAFNETVLLSVREPPVTVEGEVVLWGDAVALGYVDGDDRGRFPVRDGRRGHATGDVVRWRSGTTVWMGRTDRQLKRNGRMVCPEEVEAVAGGMLGVACACLPSGRDLVLVVHGEAPADLRTRIARTMGDAFRPTRVACVREWPLNANGKTDVSALRAMVPS